jgi:hypothetical protein
MKSTLRKSVLHAEWVKKNKNHVLEYQRKWFKKHPQLQKK